MLIIIFLKKITLLKILNFFKITISYIISVIANKPITWGMPYSISVEPTNFCNLKCKECPSGLKLLTRQTGYMNTTDFINIANQTYKYLLNMFIYFQGEPFLNKDIFEMIKYANSKNIFVTTSTNGHFLSPENCYNLIKSGLDKIIISIDGTTQNVYQTYRVGGRLQKVIDGVKNLSDTKKRLKTIKPYIVIQFLVTSYNESQISDMQKLCKSLKVNKLELKTIQVYDFINNANLIPLQKKYSRYILKNGKYLMRKQLNNRCQRLWNATAITWEGDVLPCCFDKNADHIFGNLRTNNLKDIINSEAANKFKSTILTHRRKIKICNNCTS